MKKAIKHEFKDSWLEITIICVAFIIMSAITAFLLRLSSSYFSSLLVIAMILLYGIAIVVLLINIIRSFNNRIFGNEGYLTLTLPISIDKIILSKLIVNFILMIAVAGTLIIGIGLMLIIIGDFDTNSIIVIFEAIFNNFGSFVLTIIYTLIQALFALVLLVFVLSILNIGKIRKFKFLVGIILYYIISTIVGWLGNLLLIIPYRALFSNGSLTFEKFTIQNQFILAPLMGYINLNVTFWSLVAIVGFYLLTRYIIKNLLELE